LAGRGGAGGTAGGVGGTAGGGGCTSGMKKCNGMQPQTCNNGQWENTGAACGACNTCAPATGTCMPVTNGTGCDDGNACTQTDSCQSGACVGASPVTCSTSALCKVAGVCNPSTGVCSAPTNAPNGTGCNDTDVCTSPDSCQGGVCTGTQILCNSPPACKLNTTCSAGACNYNQNVPDGTMDSKCGSGTPVCFSGGCVRCTSDTQCLGSTPSCHPTSHTCVCRRPSAGNRLVNPGFDGTFTPWTVSTAFLAADSEACPDSNSVYVDNGENEPQECIALTPGTYFFGGRFRGGFLGNFFRIRFFTGANCTGTNDEVADVHLPGSFADWTSYWDSVTVPAGTVSASVYAFSVAQYFDQLYLNTANQF
jgi:hypothetical protein